MGLSLLCRHEKKVWARRRKSSVRVPDSSHSRSGFIVFSYFEFLGRLCFRSRSPQGKRVHHHGNGEVSFKKLFNLPRARWREKLRIHPRWLAKGLIGWCLGLLACPKEYANVTGALEWKKSGLFVYNSRSRLLTYLLKRRWVQIPWWIPSLSMAENSSYCYHIC